MCIKILLPVIIFLLGFYLYKNMDCFKNSNKDESFNISELPEGKTLTNSEFSHAFEQIPLPASDELSEIGGRYAMYQNIESPILPVNVPVYKADDYLIGVD